MPQARILAPSGATFLAPWAVLLCSRPHAFPRLQPERTSLRLASPKALVLDVLSAQFRKRAGAAGLAVNPAFAGAYDFTRNADFGDLMRTFIEGLPEGGLVMCHPGFVDDVLRGLDPMTDVREREHAYLAGDGFARLLAENNVTLA